MPPTVEDIIQHDSVFRDAGDIHVEPVKGGFANHVFKIQTETKHYFLRINSEQHNYLRLDLKQEFQALSSAAVQQIAPVPIAYNTEKGYLLLEYIHCQPMTIHEFKDIANLKQLFVKLKKVHQIRGIQRICDAYHLIERYIEGARHRKVTIPSHFDEFLKQVSAIQHQRQRDLAYTQKFCHNDFYPFNIVKSHDDYVIVDWELCGIGDIFFDLAIFPSIYTYTEAEERALLHTYFDDQNADRHFDILQQMKFVNVVREAAWAYFYTGLQVQFATHDFNYARHAEFVLGKLMEGKNSLELES